MGKKKQKALKITLICIAAIVAILFFVSILLNSYLKKTIEASFNETLNAKVSIDKVRFRFFTSKIDIYKLEIIGVSEFEDETLLSVDKASIKIKDFRQEDNKIILENFILEKPIIKNITLESGLNSWKECLKKQTVDTTSEDFENYRLFCENIEINNAKLQNENRKDNEIHSLQEIYANFSLWENEKMIGGDYQFRSVFDLKENKKNKMSLSINASGGIFFENSEFRTYSQVSIDNNPFEVNITYNYDSSLNKPSTIQLIADMSEWDFGQSVESSGLLNIDFRISGISQNLIIPNAELEIYASEISFINKQTQDSAFCDFGLELDYNTNNKMLIGMKSYDFNAYLLNDSINGSFKIEFNDSLCIANTEMNGEINFDKLNKIFTDSNIDFNGILSFDSNLIGEMNSSINTLGGEFNLVYSDRSLNNYYDLYLDKHTFYSNLKIESNFITGSSSVHIPEIENVYSDKSTEFICKTNIKKIEIPLSSNTEYEVPQSFNHDTPQISFPNLSSTNYTFTIDSLFIGEILYSDINANLIYSPDMIGLKNLNLSIEGNAITSYMYFFKNKDESIEFKNKLEAFDFDLSNFSNLSKDLEGVISIQSYNHLFSINDSIQSDKNYGRNSITLTDFKLQNNILQEYEIEEDYIEIDSLDLKIDLDKNMLVLSPTEFNVNDISLSGQAHMDLNSEKLMLETFINVPDKYLSTEVKLLISLFSESVNNRTKQRDNDRNIYKLRISGAINNLKYKVFKY